MNALVSFYERSLNMDDYLTSVYYDPKRSRGFGGVDRLYKGVKKEGKFNISRTENQRMVDETRCVHSP